MNDSECQHMSVNRITLAGLEDTSMSVGDTKFSIRNGILISGIIDKKTVGPSPGGILHVKWNAFGALSTDDSLSSMKVLVNNYVLYRVQYIRIGDTIADDALMKHVIEDIQKSEGAVKKLIKQTK